jgi:hypothetical protein
MTLPASGAISFSNINTELCRSSTAQLSLNDSCLRTLFGQASGAVCMNTGHGKTNTSVPGAPTGVSASASTYSSASVSFSAPGCTGHLTIDSYQAISSPGCFTATGSGSPISITGLSGSTSYTFRVRAHNSKGYGCYSSSSGSITTPAQPTYLSISTTGASVATNGNYKTATWTGSGCFTVNSLGNTGNYANKINYVVIAGGGAGGYLSNGGGGGGGAGGVLNCCGCLCSSGYAVTTGSYTVAVGAGGTCSYGGYRSGDACGSYFSGPTTKSATRGGGGGCICYPTYRSKVNGGSGGGGGYYGCSPGSGGSGTSGQGNSGGNAAKGGCGTFYYYQYGGGGGGAGSAGSNFSGGNGRYISFLGATYAGGGGGGATSFPCSSVNSNNPTPGGSGGGGNGLNRHITCFFNGYDTHNTPGRGAINTGSGGGGAGANYGGCCSSRPGGSGLVAIRWRFQ